MAFNRTFCGNRFGDYPLRALIMFLLTGWLSGSAWSQIAAPSMGEAEEVTAANFDGVLPETTIWQQDFSSGIPSNWINSGYYDYAGPGSSTTPFVSPFEYRGPNTVPTVTTGSRGIWVGTPWPIESPTASNGFVIFDSDYQHNVMNKFGIHFAVLASHSFSLANNYNVDLNFSQFYRRFRGPNNDVGTSSAYIDFSTDNGISWFGGLPINDNIGWNESTISTSRKSIPIGAYVGGFNNVRIRFRFEGMQYFWMLDDISLTATPAQRISFFGKQGGLNPEVLLSFTKGQVSNGGYPIGQARPLAVDANVWNSGSATLTNIRLVALIIKPNGLKDSLYSASIPPLLPNDSVHLGNVFPNWLPTSNELHKVVIVARTNQGRWVYPDTLLIDNATKNLNAAFYSTKPQRYTASSAISTSYMGDGSEVWTGFYVNQQDTVFNFSALLLSGSRIGSFMEWELLDSSQFEADAGDYLLSGTYVLNFQDSVLRKASITFCQPKILAKGRYYIKVRLWKGTPNGSIGLRNWISNRQVIGSNWFRFANSSYRAPNYFNSLQFNTPNVTLGFERFSNQIPVAPGDLDLIVNGDSVLCAGQSRILTAPSGYTYSWNTGETTQTITSGTAGYYWCTLTTNGCILRSDTIHLRVHTPKAFSIAAQPSTTFCQGDSTRLFVPFNATKIYSWSNGKTTNAQYVKAGGTYTLTRIDSLGCTKSSSITTTMLTVPTIQISTNGPLAFCPGGSVTLYATAGGSSYLWSNGATSQSITVNATGSYGVSMGLINGCTSRATPVQVVPAAPPASVTASGPLNFCPGGSVTLSAPAGYSYLWSNGATTQSITATAAGSYTVTVSQNGCSSTSAAQVVTVNAGPPSTVSASGPITFCQGGSVTLSAPAGYSYLWSNGATTQSITPTTSGSYSVVVSANGCSSTSSAQTVTVNPLPPSTVTASGALTFCQGGSVTLSAPAGYSYLWSTGATTQTLSPSTSGSYTVVVTENGCSSTSAAQAVTIYPLPPSTVSASGPLTLCQGGSVTLSAPAGYSYLWNNGATTQSITASASGSYSVTVSANGCSSTSSTQAVTVNPLPPSTVTSSGAMTFCQGGSVTLSAPAGYSYLWSTGATTQTISPNTSGSYSVVVSANGCNSTSAAQVVTVHPIPPSSVAVSGPLTFCQGSSVTLSAPAGYSYLWSNGATTQGITATATGSYFVTVSANGCSSTSTAQQVTVHPLPPASVTASGPLTLCQGSSVTLSAPAGYSYLWSNGATTQSISVSASGSYGVTVSANGCSSNSTSQVVTVNPTPPSNVVASGPLTFCQGGSVALVAPSGYAYVWSNGATTQSINATTSGTFTVTVYGNGCSSTSAPVQVSVIPNPSAAVTASGSLSFCHGGSVTLVAPAGGTYLWSNGAITQSISVTSAGVYSVVVTANGCSTTSANQQVNVLPVPPATVTASGSLTFCEGGSVGLMAPAGFSYAWSTGATTQSIVASATGAYSVTVSDNTCSATSSPVAVTAVVNNLTPQVFGTTLANVNTIQSYFTSQNLGNGYTWGVQGGSVVTGQGTNAVTVFMGTSGNVKVFVMETNGYCSEGDTLVVKVSGLGMEEEGIQGRLRVYPVPSNGTFTVVPPSTEGILQVVDMVGRLIHQEPITSEKMTIEGVPPGVYTVLAYTNGLRSECRMVVQ